MHVRHGLKNDSAKKNANLSRKPGVRRAIIHGTGLSLPPRRHQIGPLIPFLPPILTNLCPREILSAYALKYLLFLHHSLYDTSDSKSCEIWDESNSHIINGKCPKD